MRKTLPLLVLCGFVCLAVLGKKHHRKEENEEFDTLAYRQHFPRSRERRGGSFGYGEESDYDLENPEPVIH